MSLYNNDWRKIIKALAKFGFEIARQRGSHIILKKEGKIISVPRHSPVLMPTLRSILAQAGISEEEFLKRL